MFWTEHFKQMTFFDGDVTVATRCMSELMRFAVSEFPNMESDFHRRVAFLTHEETQNFLGPMLLRRFGTLDDAKVPTLNWLEAIGSFETLARLARKNEDVLPKSKIASLEPSQQDEILDQAELGRKPRSWVREKVKLLKHTADDLNDDSAEEEDEEIETHAETCVKSWRKTESRLLVLKVIASTLEPHEWEYLIDLRTE